MDKERKEIEELAKTLFEICEYPNPDNWEHEDTNRRIWEIRASILYAQGYRLYHLSENAIQHASTPTLQALDEDKLEKLLNTKKALLSGSKDIAKLICATFGQSPMASEEELSNFIRENFLEVQIYNGTEVSIAKAILQFLTKESA